MMGDFSLSDDFSNALKLPYHGSRNSRNGIIQDKNTIGNYWSSSQNQYMNFES
jgi:hypothetical protein